MVEVILQKAECKGIKDHRHSEGQEKKNTNDQQTMGGERDAVGWRTGDYAAIEKGSKVL